MCDPETKGTSVLDFETLLVESAGPVGRITLNRPEKLNALSRTVLAELAEAARALDRVPEVRVVVVGGAGRAFSAGADLADFADLATGGVADPHAAADLGRRMADAIEAMRAVTVARIQGRCVGGGVVLAGACDLRVASADAIFSIPEVDLGIPLAWGGIPRLVRDIGPVRTKDLVLTCREFAPDEALAAGFLTRVVEPPELDAAVERLAGSLAAKARLPLTATKAHVNAVTDGMVQPGRSFADAASLVASLGDRESVEAAARYRERLG